MVASPTSSILQLMICKKTPQKTKKLVFSNLRSLETYKKSETQKMSFWENGMGRYVSSINFLYPGHTSLVFLGLFQLYLPHTVSHIDKASFSKIAFFESGVRCLFIFTAP